jgi:hypothetical protein
MVQSSPSDQRYSLDSDLRADVYRLRNLIVQMGHKDGAAREEAASLAAVSTAAASLVLTPARVFVARVLSLKY